MSPTSATYNGSSQKNVIDSAVTVTYNNKPLTLGQDYNLSYYTDVDGKPEHEIKEADDANAFITARKIYVKVTGKSANFSTDSVMYSTPFEIKARALSNVKITLSGDVSWNDNANGYAALFTSSAIKPTVTVTDETLTPTKTLDKATTKNASTGDYYYDDTQAECLTGNDTIGTGTVTIEGINNYASAGTKTANFYIYGRLAQSDSTTGRFATDDITDSTTYTLNKDGEPVADGKSKVFNYQEVTFKKGGAVLTYGKNFTATITDPENNDVTTTMDVPGKKRITYTGLGITSGCVGSQYFDVTVKGDLTYATITQGVADNYDYKDSNGKGAYPAKAPLYPRNLTVTLNGNQVPSSAYSLVYGSMNTADNTDYSPIAGKQDAYVKITANADSYYLKDQTKYFNIRYNLKDSDVKISVKDGETLSISDSTDDLKNKIEVKVGKRTDALDPTYFRFNPDPTWRTTNQTSNVASLDVYIIGDANETYSYGTKKKTLEGERKDLSTDNSDINIDPTDAMEFDYSGTDYFTEIREGFTVTDAGESLTLDSDYAVTIKDASGSTVKSVIKAGNYTATFTGVKNYYTVKGKEITRTITVKPIDINTLSPRRDENSTYYTSTTPAPVYTITDTNGYTLEEGTDYEVTYAPTTSANNWKAGTQLTVTIKGKGNYSGTYTDSNFEIQPIDLANSTKLLSITSEAVYDGKKHEPEFTIVRVDSKGNTVATLSEDEYTVKSTSAAGTEFINAGKYPCTITGKADGNYTGTLNYDFEIAPRSLVSGSGISVTLDLTKNDYTGNPVEPVVTVKDDGIGLTNPVLTETKDYTVTYENNTASHADSGDDAPVAKITGTGNYTGEVDKYFQIGTDLSLAAVTLDNYTHGYDGTAFRPTVTSVTLNGKQLTETTDYTGPTYTTTGGAVLTGSEPTAKGTYKATVTGTGAYFGTASADYTITAQNASRADILVEFQTDSAMQTDDSGAPFWYYTGEAITPAVKVYYSPDDDTKTELTGGDADSTTADYYLTYSNNVNAGEEASITVHLINNYADFSLTLNGGTKADFDGTAQTKAFTLSGKNPAGQTVSKVYSGTAVQIETEAANDGLNVNWTNNIAPGTANLQVSGTGNGNYTGTAPLATMTIVGVISDATITVARSTNIQAKVTPKVTVDFKDKSGTSHIIDPDSGWYDVTYRADTGNWKTATKVEVTVKGVEPLLGTTYITGTKKAYGELTDEPTGLFLTGYNATYQYTGQSISPSGIVVSGSAMQGGNISVVGLNCYSNKDDTACIVPGTVTMSAIVSYKDSAGETKTTVVSEDANGNQAKFRILKRSLKSCDIIGPVDVRYNGSAQEPVVSISADGNPLTPGKDYKITGYVNNTKPGTATVSITAGDNGYVSGKTSKTFTIFVANVTGLTATSVSTTSAKISWSASPSVDGYLLTYENTKGVQKVQTKNLTYTVTDLPTDDSTQVAVQAFVNEGSTPTYFGDPNTIFAKTALTATTTTGSSSGGRNTVRWSTVSGANGYEIWRATRKDGTYELLTTATASATSYTDSHATVGTTYYYKVRAYKINTTAGSTYGQKYGYSNYSNSVAITTVN